MKSYFLLVLAALLLATPVGRTKAQGVFDMGALTNTLTIPTKSSKGATMGKPAAATSLAYVPTAALKQKTVQGYVDRFKAKNPAASEAVETNFGPGKYDYGTIYRD